jgi:hypothetical protein
VKALLREAGLRFTKIELPDAILAPDRAARIGHALDNDPI